MIIIAAGHFFLMHLQPDSVFGKLTDITIMDCQHE